jgi:hypothetical protein
MVRVLVRSIRVKSLQLPQIAQEFVPFDMRGTLEMTDGSGYGDGFWTNVDQIRSMDEDNGVSLPSAIFGL